MFIILVSLLLLEAFHSKKPDPHPWFMPVILVTWDVDGHGLRPAWENSVRDPISKITRAKWTGGVAQVVEYLLCKCKTPCSNQKQNCEIAKVVLRGKAIPLNEHISVYIKS
jgi:hypothetical protein